MICEGRGSENPMLWVVQLLRSKQAKLSALKDMACILLQLLGRCEYVVKRISD